MEGRGEVHGFLTSREIGRAIVAHWWGTTTDHLRRIPEREFRLMAEFMERTERKRAEAVEAAKMGMPTPGRPSL